MLLKVILPEIHFTNKILAVMLVSTLYLGNIRTILSFKVDTVFQRLVCHEGFKLTSSHKPSKIETAIELCKSEFKGKLPNYRDCFNLCIAENIHMFNPSQEDDNVNKFNKVSLTIALREWFADDENGHYFIRTISHSIEKCVIKHANVTNRSNCEPNLGSVDTSTNQTILWSCIKNILTCAPVPTPRASAVTSTAKSYHKKSSYNDTATYEYHTQERMRFLSNLF